MFCRNCGEENVKGAAHCKVCGESLESILEDDDFGISASSAYSNGWHQLKRHFPQLVVISLIFAVIAIPSTVFGAAPDYNAQGISTGTGFIAFLFSTFLTNPAGYGVGYAYLRAVRDEPFERRDMFAGFRIYWRAVLAGFAVSAIVFIGIVLLVVPGIYFACKLVFVPFLVVDRDLTVADALSESWCMTTGYVPDILVMILLAIPIFIAGLLLIGIGAFFALMLITASFAALYHAINLHGDQEYEAGSMLHA